MPAQHHHLRRRRSAARRRELRQDPARQPVPWPRAAYHRRALCRQAGSQTQGLPGRESLQVPASHHLRPVSQLPLRPSLPRQAPAQHLAETRQSRSSDQLAPQRLDPPQSAAQGMALSGRLGRAAPRAVPVVGRQAVRQVARQVAGQLPVGRLPIPGPRYLYPAVRGRAD